MLLLVRLMARVELVPFPFVHNSKVSAAIRKRMPPYTGVRFAICYDRTTMKELLNQIAVHRSGALALLAVAAFLEAYGDSCFQSGLYRTAGWTRWLAFAAGAASLAGYGLVVNAPRWEFGKLLGVYVVVFFLLAQILARVRFGQAPTTSIWLGGALIVAGGVVISVGGVM